MHSVKIIRFGKQIKLVYSVGIIGENKVKIPAEYIQQRFLYLKNIKFPLNNKSTREIYLIYSAGILVEKQVQNPR